MDSKTKSLTMLLTLLFINTANSREAQPIWQSNKEDWPAFQARHCKWERGIPCKTIPEDQGKPPPRTAEENAIEIASGMLMGPMQKPRGFKVTWGAKPSIKPTVRPRINITSRPSPRLSPSSERAPLLSPSPKPKPKISGRLQRINGKVGILLGDSNPPTMGGETSAKRVKLELLDSHSSSSTEVYDVEGDIAIEKNKIDRIETIKQDEVASIKEEIKSIYSQQTLDNSELDINDEIEHYNSTLAHEKITFREYFAIRNYQEGRFVEINNAMRGGSSNDELNVEITEVQTALDNHSDINISIREDGYIISEEESTVDEVYRGEVRDRAEFLEQVTENETIKIDSFLSTTADEEMISQFNSDDLEDGQVNVSYTIRYYLGRTTSTDVSDILDESGNERIFLPRSRFLVTHVEEVDTSTFKVNLLALCDEPPDPPFQPN
ncbi:hypothetical protein [Yersinia alsatica]|uniref:hypothetical protein n=1 Tax=Yersinia alsatica TaxID=2890317 RepID=UPI0011A70FE6|nr:hypothetical protein [Yersinia alsatica]